MFDMYRLVKGEKMEGVRGRGEQRREGGREGEESSFVCVVHLIGVQTAPPYSFLYPLYQIQQMILMYIFYDVHGLMNVYGWSECAMQGECFSSFSLLYLLDILAAEPDAATRGEQTFPLKSL